jgi:hypothetical protein
LAKKEGRGLETLYIVVIPFKAGKTATGIKILSPFGTIIFSVVIPFKAGKTATGAISFFVISVDMLIHKS